MNVIKKMYETLLNSYGPQGWWPLSGIGYHPKRYYLPKTHAQIFEVYVGAILTQNTSWKNVEKALYNLKRNCLLSTDAMLQQDKEELIKHSISSVSYYNQKCKRLVGIAKFYISLRNRVPTRKELMSLNGIGKETADSILLYAYRVPTFVVDTYTRRIATSLKLIKKDARYEDIQKLFMDNLPKDFKIYQEYHALLVEHAKRYYSKKSKKELPKDRLAELFRE